MSRLCLIALLIKFFFHSRSTILLPCFLEQSPAGKYKIWSLEAYASSTSLAVSFGCLPCLFIGRNKLLRAVTLSSKSFTGNFWGILHQYAIFCFDGLRNSGLSQHFPQIDLNCPAQCKHRDIVHISIEGTL